MSVASLIKQQVYQSVVHTEEGDDEWPPNDIMGIIRWFSEIASEIPPNLLHSARCEITAVDGDVGNPPNAVLKVGYFRPETSKEAEARIRNMADIVDRQRQKEITELERLLTKYPEYRRL